MRDPHTVLVKPMVTEKSMFMMEDNKYSFIVDKNANKIEIKEAVETLFKGTKVKSVNVMNCRGKERRRGYTSGKTAAYRKAIVTLTEDSKTIPFFDSLT